jgi:uncharacterized membrane protein
MKNVIFDGIMGGLLFGVISYLSNIYGQSYPHFYKVLAFVWAVPLTNFYLLLIASRKDKMAMKEFAVHSILGTILTLLLAILTILIIKFDKNIIIIISFLFAVITTLMYFIFEIYKLI